MTDKHLVVLLEGQLAGRLDRDGGKLRFTYDGNYRNGDDPTPISLSLPLAQQQHTGTPLENFLWGLLPDSDRVLERWAQRFDTTPGSVFGLLSGAGEDCAGAVQFVRPERIAELQLGRGHRAVADDAWIAGRIRAIRTDSAAWLPAEKQSEGQWSLAGAQPKFALAQDGQGWFRPTGAIPTTHIFKPNTSPFADFDINEYLCLATARTLGVAAAGAALMTFEDQRVLVVERYDRANNGERVHQEDLCQALGINPQRKYQNAKGPGVRSVRSLLDSRVDADQAQRVCEGLISALAFHWLVLNTDGHAKNFSLLLVGAQVRLAPLYDVASACVYQRTTPGEPVVGELRSSGLKLALSIGSEYEANRITDDNWRKCADDLGLDREWVLSTVANLATGMPDAVLAARATLGDSLSGAFANRFVELMERRSLRCLELLKRTTAG
jgi:serine/threonine-protein kinase HipA